MRVSAHRTRLSPRVPVPAKPQGISEPRPLGRVDAVGEVGIDGTKMLKVPRVDRFRFHLGGATEEESVVDPATGENGLGSLRDGAVIFVLIEGDDRATVANLLDEQQRLVGRDQLLDRQGGHRGVDLGEGVESAGGLLLIGGSEQLEAALVLSVTASEGSDHDGRVEKFLHPSNSRERCSRSRSIRRGMDVWAGSPW
jgi:hypothetical protein